jgi:hypothetical protein
MSEPTAEDLDRLFPEVERTVNEVHARLANPRPPQTLFHYTSVTGLKGILESSELWALIIII